MTHASIVPLIGGETLGQMAAFGSNPEYLLSYSAFKKNDAHLVHYLPDVPYHVLDEGGTVPYGVDVISTVCPCAGLSSLSPAARSDAPANDWLYRTTEFVLGTVRPRVLWGENAPRFAGSMGRPIVERLLKTARANGYTMSVYRTKSLLHGLPQVRERTFYFFWQGDTVPLFEYFHRPYETIEDLLARVPSSATQSDLTNDRVPSRDEMFYRYTLEVIESGMSHRDFHAKISKSMDIMDYIEAAGHNYRTDLKPYFTAHGSHKMAARMDRMQAKLDAGQNIFRREGSHIPKGYIGAFIGHLPYLMTHPYEDRYLTYREAMSIMGLPTDFTLLNPRANLNHVCQNVPVQTATDMAHEVIATLNGQREMLQAPLLYQFNGKKTYRAEYEPRQYSFAQIL